MNAGLMKKESLLANLPTDLSQEFFKEIINTGYIRIEQIVSNGHTSPKLVWYDQDENEWVVVIKGAGELTNEVTLPEADVMRFVRMDKKFIGKDATLAGPLRWICVYLEIEGDGPSDGHGGEAVLANGRQIGSTSSMAFGHCVGRLLAFAYIDPDFAAPGTDLQVVIMGELRRAKFLNAPAYDPANERPRAG